MSSKKLKNRYDIALEKDEEDNSIFILENEFKNLQKKYQEEGEKLYGLKAMRELIEFRKKEKLDLIKLVDNIKSESVNEVKCGESIRDKAIIVQAFISDIFQDKDELQEELYSIIKESFDPGGVKIKVEYKGNVLVNESNKIRVNEMVFIEKLENSRHRFVVN